MATLLETAQEYIALSRALRQARDRTPLPPAEFQQLSAQVAALYNFGQDAIAGAYAAVADRLQPHLARITQATREAKDALEELNDRTKLFRIADNAVELAASIRSAEGGAIARNLASLADAVKS